MPAIRVEHLGKTYRIYRRPVDRLLEAILRRPRHQPFPALGDVSFTVPKGGTLGVIGDNGAGKSTLLKLLVGTVTPTAGTVQVQGRVAALLELGAGFHMEFSGRQNIFLNAALMGIAHAEIVRKEDEIIGFSGLGAFIDRPVKMYSSGMHVRLAFAIATSVDPDILVIDEALAVGDMAFQHKCVERMQEFREQGKTMLFCSHSMYGVRELCSTVLWLMGGRVHQLGPAQEVTEAYEEFSQTRINTGTQMEISPQPTAAGSEKRCRILSLRLETPDGEPLEGIEPLSQVVFAMEVEILQDQLRPQFGFALIMDNEAVYSMALTHHDRIECGPYREGSRIRVRLRIHDFPLRTGICRLIGGVAEKQGLLWHEMEQLGPIKISGNTGHGLITFKRDWELEALGPLP